MNYVRAIVLACAGLSTATASQAAPSVAERLLRAHNMERSALGAPPMIWDSALASAADVYAAEMAATGRWGHSQPAQRTGQGENLWMGTRSAFAPEKMIADWVSEKSMFRSGTFPNVSSTGSWHDVGHYTQIVWPGTQRVGCSIRSSSRHDYLVCRYSAAGNVIGGRVGRVSVAAR